MTIIEKVISDKTEQVKSIKPKYYLFFGYLSTLISLQLIVLITLPIVHIFLRFLSFSIIESETSTDLIMLLTRISFLLVEMMMMALSFDFSFSNKKLDKFFKIEEYQTALYELSILKKKKEILDEANKIEKSL